MKLKVWGARGSVPAPGPEMNRYGGNTSCVELELSDGSTLIIDAGTGIRSLGVGIAKRAAEDPHPAHPPAPRPHPGADVLRSLLPLGDRDHDLGPVVPRGIARGADLALHLRAALPRRGPRASLRGELPRHPRRPSGRSVRPRSAPRRSPTAARRSATGSPTATTTLTYISDHEPGLGAPLEILEPEWISGYDLARDADLLIHDCQYTDEEYPEHVGWGHSRLTDTLHVRAAGRGAAAAAVPPRPAALRRLPRSASTRARRSAGPSSAAPTARSRWRPRPRSSRSALRPRSRRLHDRVAPGGAPSHQGRRSAQGRSASSWAASEISVASSLGRATSITERGRPPSLKPGRDGRRRLARVVPGRRVGIDVRHPVDRPQRALAAPVPDLDRELRRGRA